MVIKRKWACWLRNAWAFHTVHSDLRLGDLRKYRQYNSTELPHLHLCLEQSLVLSQWTSDLRHKRDKINSY